jgi:hypothetical protein
MATQAVNESAQPISLSETQKSGPAQWRLPNFLRESSGLAILDSNYLLIHDDEKGNIYRVSIASKEIELVASIGAPPVDEDFEGIAYVGSTIYLITSTGIIWQVAETNTEELNQIVSARTIDPGLKPICEIEGLHNDNGALLLPCKMHLTEDVEGQLIVFAYDLASGDLSEALRLDLSDAPGSNEVRPTAIDTTSTDYYIISTNRLLVIDRTTMVTRVFSLPKKRHFQPEGLAVLEDGSIVIVDDNRKGRSRLTHYTGLTELKEK